MILVIPFEVVFFLFMILMVFMIPPSIIHTVVSVAQIIIIIFYIIAIITSIYAIYDDDYHNPASKFFRTLLCTIILILLGVMNHGILSDLNYNTTDFWLILKTFSAGITMLFFGFIGGWIVLELSSGDYSFEESTTEAVLYLLIIFGSIVFIVFTFGTFKQDYMEVWNWTLQKIGSLFNFIF
ncbi:hypothetical protein [Eubacterium barkeri]|uniref:Uncharacterized protein n=1 Tax=Eubacterium barkeri TaxID=1528 RepID=A0A1H3IIM1_EUBBA|nr:hypothetical protein [Eubacterium barkeri]SDY27225.1 hypothetical protein SAMN04488579_12325 [Eubacterium barkeri]